ncbi:MAG TPA: CPBP family intramembrane glutamic endopeptidase [Candidatus Limnocylindrales bacterium]|nr:CPBP family intramembrane glutamic endopeptidase [Candidatus Limnocylindrales bacterium]
MQPDGISAGATARPARRGWSFPATIILGGLLLPARETIVVVVASCVLLLDSYHTLIPIGDATLGIGLERALLYGLVPLAVLLLLGERPSRYGLRLGGWRIGLVAVLVAAVVATPIILIASGWTDVHAYYHRDRLDLGGLLLANTLELSAAEFLYRGFLMMALVRWCGPLGVVLATVPFVFMHVGKPELETLSTVFGGIGFGWLAWRTGSVLYGAALHVYILTLVIVAANL